VGVGAGVGVGVGDGPALGLGEGDALAGAIEATLGAAGEGAALGGWVAELEQAETSKPRVTSAANG
jgi:hypothetical protein